MGFGTVTLGFNGDNYLLNRCSNSGLMLTLQLSLYLPWKTVAALDSSAVLGLTLHALYYRARLCYGLNVDYVKCLVYSYIDHLLACTKGDSKNLGAQTIPYQRLQSPALNLSSKHMVTQPGTHHLHCSHPSFCFVHCVPPCQDPWHILCKGFIMGPRLCVMHWLCIVVVAFFTYRFLAWFRLAMWQIFFSVKSSKEIGTLYQLSPQGPRWQ